MRVPVGVRMAVAVVVTMIVVMVVVVVIMSVCAHANAYTPFPRTAKLVHDNALNVIM